MNIDFKVGDSVATKPNTKDPDMGGDISGWQGRVAAIQQYEKAEALTIMIAWGNITL